MSKLKSCKSCGEQISKKAKACPKCGHEIKKTHWVTWLVLFGIVGYALMPEPTAEEKALEEARIQKIIDNMPKTIARKGLDLKFDFKKVANGNIMVADFIIKNDSNITVKDITIKCNHYSNSDTNIDSNTRTIYEIIKPHSSKSIKEQNMGFIHSQVAKSACSIVDFVIVDK